MNKVKANFNEMYPNAYNIEIGSNNSIWGVWYSLKGKPQRRFLSFMAIYGENSMFELEFENNGFNQLFEDQMIYIGLN